MREAGGHVTRTNGEPDIFSEPTSILATNGHLHEEMLAVLNRLPYPDRNSDIVVPPDPLIVGTVPQMLPLEGRFMFADGHMV